MNARKFARAAGALLLVAALLLAGCGYNPENVMTIDGEQVPAGRWLYYQLSAINSAVAELDDSTVNGVDVLSHDIDGTPARDWVRAETVDSCKRYAFIEKEFERLGLALEQAELDYIKNNAEMMWQYYAKDIYEANGVGYDTFMAVYLNGMKEGSVIESLYSPGGEQAIPEADKQAYFDANFAAYEAFTLPQNNSLGYSLLESNPDEVNTLAARMLEKAKTDGLSAAYLELYGEALVLAQDTTTVVDAESAKTAVTSSVAAEALSSSKDLVLALLATPVGEFGSVAADGVMYIFKRAALPADTTESTYDASIIAAMSAEPFEEYVAEGAKAMEVVPDERALSYYSPDKAQIGA